MSGDTTRPRPPAATAGAWKQSDLPPPVGSTTMLSRDCRIACIASRWRGRNSEKPQTRWSASRSNASAADGRPVSPKLGDRASSEGGSASGVVVLDVVIDQTLKLRRELVVRAVQRLDVLAVDEDRTARLLARAGQADADARRLRFAGPVDDAAHHRERHLFDAFALHLPGRHHLADVVLDPLGELLERAARRAAAAGARRDARRERPQSERLQQLARRVHLFAAIAVGPRRERDANRVADPLVQQD